MVFRDRVDAGSRLAARLVELELDRPVVLALARGGVPVAVPVAAALGAPLEPLVVRKLGAPAHPELGIGALSEDGAAVINGNLAARLGLGRREIEALLEREAAEVVRRVQLYREGRELSGLRGRDVVIVDDGMATGLTDFAAVLAVRRHAPRSVVVAVPVAGPEALALVGEEADEVVALHVPRALDGVGRWYDDFRQVSDAEVLEALSAVRDAPRRA